MRYATRRLQNKLKDNGYKPETISKIIEFYTKG